MGAPEPQRGCDGGGTDNLFIACTTAFAASLKLDSSHRGSAVYVESRFAGPSRQTQFSTITPPKCGSCRAPARLRRRRHRQPLHRLNHRYRSLAKARQLPQEIGGLCGISVCRAIAPNTTLDNNTAQMWELSSPSEAAMAAAQAKSSAPELPLSQPR